MAKHKYIENPEKLYSLFKEYQDWCKSNPKYENVLIHKSGEIVSVPRERPLTWKGFEMYLFDKNIISDLGDYEKDKGGRYSEYAPIIRTIKSKIYNDKFDGATVGIFQHNIIARDLGLADKKDHSVTVNEGVTYFDPDEEE